MVLLDGGKSFMISSVVLGLDTHGRIAAVMCDMGLKTTEEVVYVKAHARYAGETGNSIIDAAEVIYNLTVLLNNVTVGLTAGKQYALQPDGDSGGHTHVSLQIAVM